MFSPPCPRPRRAAPRRRALLPCSSVPAHPHPHPPAALASPGAPLLSRLIASSRSRASTPTFLASRALHLIQLSGTVSLFWYSRVDVGLSLLFWHPAGRVTRTAGRRVSGTDGRASRTSDRLVGGTDGRARRTGDGRVDGTDGRFYCSRFGSPEIKL